VVVLGVRELERGPQLRLLLAARDEHVEDVVVPFALGLERHARLLQQVVDDGRADDAALRVELDGDELAEAARVVVAERLRVALRLEDGVRL
jgi:hypothetical protein